MAFQMSDFKIIKIIGKGKYGCIYKAKKIKDGQIYALKEIESDPKKEEEILKEEILKEENIMKKMKNGNHPNIMKYYDKFEFHKRSYFILEYIEGENLVQLIEKTKKQNYQNIDQNLIIIILKGIINGLCYMHKINIIHRDISPDNIMIDKDNNVKITDFGISKFFDTNNNQKNQKDFFATVIGKKIYVSPEIYNAGLREEKTTKYNYKTDIYSLGLTMFYLMTFKLPFNIGKNKEKKKNNITIDPNIYNEDLIKIVMSMLKEDQYERPSAIDIYNALGNLIGEKKMDCYYKLNINDIKLENNYLIKRSAFLSVIYCLCNIDQLKQYFEKDNTKKHISEIKKESLESSIMITNFMEILGNLKTSINQNDIINKFLGIISQKILMFGENIKLTPKLIINKLFDYVLYNMYDLSKFLIYNNNTGYKIYNIIENDPNISFLVKQKVEEFKNNNSNIFSDMFNFLILKRIICPNCNNVIEENIDIEYDIEFDHSDYITNLFNEFEKKRIYDNSGKKSKICPKCYIMPLNYILIKNIFSTPNILIIHTENIYNINELIELKEYISPNINIKYALFAMIIKESNNTYNFSIKNVNNDKWTYNSSETSVDLDFVQVLQKGKIVTTFYKVRN